MVFFYLPKQNKFIPYHFFSSENKTVKKTLGLYRMIYRKLVLNSLTVNLFNKNLFHTKYLNENNTQTSKEVNKIEKKTDRLSNRPNYNRIDVQREQTDKQTHVRVN